jgi:hypothetical protein
MSYWKWIVNEGKELEKILFEYLRSCRQMKTDIIQAVEAFYLPYALKYMGASPLEVRKAYQKSIDTLQSRVRIMALDAGISIDANVNTQVRVDFDSDSSPLEDRQQLEKDEVDEVDDELPINPLRKISKLAE